MKDLYIFTNNDSLEEHGSDCEDNVGKRVRVSVIGDPICNEGTLDVPPMFNTIGVVGQNLESSNIEGFSSPLQSSTQQIQPDESIGIAATGSRVPADEVEVERLTENEGPTHSNTEGDEFMEMDATTTIEGLRDWLRENKGVVDIFFKYGLEYSVMDDILLLFGGPCKSWKSVVSYISRASLLSEKVEAYSICMGHSCYAVLKQDNSRTCRCSVCNTAIPEPT